jgi:hypothetical protein
VGQACGAGDLVGIRAALQGGKEMNSSSVRAAQADVTAIGAPFADGLESPSLEQFGELACCGMCTWMSGVGQDLCHNDSNRD